MIPLLSDMVTAYTARARGEEPRFAPLTVQFADYALWQHRELGSADDPTSVIGSQIAYWTRQLRGIPDVLELPTDRQRPAVASNRGDRIGFEISAEIGSRIERLGREYGVTPFMVLHAALAVLLSRLSATDDVTVSTPIAGRGQRELDSVIGMFVNTLVLRTELTPAMPFDELLGQVRGTDLEAYAHADVPFETLVEVLKPTRSQAFAPLAQVMLTLVAPSMSGPVYDDAGISITPLESVAFAAQYDLSFTIVTGNDGPWTGSIVYAKDLFGPASVETMAERFVTILGALTENPRAPIGEAPLIASAEREQIVRWSSGQPGPGSNTTLPSLIGRNQARSASDD